MKQQVRTDPGSRSERSLLPVLGVFVVRAAVLERVLSLFGGPATYVLCGDVEGLSARLDREASTNRWLLLAGLVLSVSALGISRLGRGRALPALLLFSVLALVILADGRAARADDIARQIAATQTCDEPTNLHDTSRGWFDW
ncbi:hypothetical protein ACIP2X_06175 [Streptomyces sp. NPDC089424]|uniref:hypothetical protein n=1 Tax=Streptomyces sp. NPDC089424 TaxID=3365917 RepID=UPI00380E986B